MPALKRLLVVTIRSVADQLVDTRACKVAFRASEGFASLQIVESAFLEAGIVDLELVFRVEALVAVAALPLLQIDPFPVNPFQLVQIGSHDQ